MCLKVNKSSINRFPILKKGEENLITVYVIFMILMVKRSLKFVDCSQG